MEARMQAQGPDGRGVGALQLVLLLLVVCMGLTFVQTVLADTTGAKTAGAIEATNGWSSFTTTVLSSASGSTTSAPGDTGEGQVSTFGLGVPAGAQIDGIQVHVNGVSGKNNQTATFGVELSGDGGTTWTSTGYTGTFSDSWPYEDKYLGGSSDDWGWASAGWDSDNCSDSNFWLKIWNTTTGQDDPVVELLEVTVWYTQAPDLSWVTGSADVKIYASSSLTWGAGTLVCSGTLSDDNASSISCASGAIANSTQYRVQVVLKNTGGADAAMASGDYVDHIAVKGGWAGTSPTLGNCAFNDLDSDNTAAICSAAWNATNDVRITNTGTEVKIAYSATNNAEGFMYLLTTDSDVPATDSTSYMNTSIDSDTEDSSKISITGPTAPNLSWATGSADFKIYASSSLTWGAGTLVCSGTLSDDNGSTISCASGEIADSTQYRVQMVLDNTGTADATMASGDYVDHVAVKGGWAGTSPTLGNCAFNDLDSDNNSATCSAAWNATNDVRLTNTGTEVKIAYSATNNAEGFMYLITTGSDVPASDSTSYMNTSIDSDTEDSSKISITGPNPDLSWATGSADFRIYASSNLTWGAGTLVCGGSLSDDNASTISCDPFTIDSSTQYRVQVVLDNTGTADATMASGDYVDHVAVKGGWAGTSPTLGNCAFQDLDSDNTSATCSAAWNATNDVRLTNTGTEVKIAYSATNNAEGFMYLITTDSDVPATDSTSYMDASIDSNTEDSSKITIGGPFPAVQDTNTSGESSDVTSHTVNLPANISAGDLLIVFFSCDANETVTWPTGDGWASIFHQTNANTLDIGYKIADGTEGATITVTTGSAEQSAHISYRITGNHRYLAPEVSTGATGNSTSPNPDSLTPTGGAKDYLWIAVEGNADGDVASAYPSNYTNGQTNAVGTTAGANIAVARRELNASSEDPVAFTIPLNKWVACTVAVHPKTAPTAIDLISLSARGDGNHVRIDWETAQEIRNLGFNLYRSTRPWGTFVKINDSLIPGLIYSVKGKSYRYIDTTVTPGTLYYYKLEDIDASGIRTLHGPVCVDWDADGMPDDWEIAHGLNPWVNDADIDADNDGLTNLEEYELGFDPFNPDSDGDGILDGQEGYRIEREDSNGSRGLTRGVQILASDETGVTIELHTETFDTEVVVAGGQEFERLRIADYIHGHTQELGKPEVPVKGIFLDLPEGQFATLSVLQTEVDTYDGYQVFPVPENILDDQGAITAVGESFVWNESAYAIDEFYPAAIAQLGDGFVFRDQIKQQVLFYPLTFNPASGQLKHYRKIQVRIDYVGTHSSLAKADTRSAAPWQLPITNGTSESIPSAGKMAIAFGASPIMVNPISPVLSSLGVLVNALWSPDTGIQGTAYKIRVEEEGIYRLTRDYLATNGVAVDALDLSQLRIYNLGAEIAIYTYDLNGDDFLDSSDYIEFYGRPVTAQYAKYGRHNVYWLLTAGGTGIPRRMAEIDGSLTAGALAATHTYSVRYEEDEYYLGLAPGDDSLDRWFFDDLVLGSDLSGTADPVPTDFTINLPAVAAQGRLTISMWGYYDTYHDVEIQVNGVVANIANWSGISFHELTLEGINFLEGDNIITLTCNRDMDAVIVDWLEITYARLFKASDNTLKFSHDSAYRYQITDFDAANLVAFDITQTTDPARVVNVAINGPNPYTVEFEPPVNPGATETYLVLQSDTGKIPVGLIEDTAADLALTANAADYILITHRDLGWDANGDAYAWLNDLVALREGQGLRVKVVDVQDIFDEFSYGMTSAAAIRDFLSYAYDNWEPPALQYVLLVGDSSYDFRDNLQLGITNYVPAYLTFTQFMGETVTDEWYVKISGNDALPDLYIGRLPAESEAEAAIMINKILTYETSPNDKTWQKNTLLIADDQNEAYEAAFENMNEDAADLLPASMNAPFKGYLNDYLAAAGLKADIKAQINAGTLIVNYSGHGALQRWAGEGIFRNSDVADLTNTGKYPFVVNMSCLTGYFGYLDPQDGPEPSMAEALLKADGKGAIATLMPTAMTSTGGQHILDAALFEAIFQKDIRNLGAAIADAKHTLLANGGTAYEEVSETFLLLGDPALTLQVPIPHKPTEIEVQRTQEGIIISWQAVEDSSGNPVAGYNIYRSASPDGNYSKINIELITETEYLDSDPEGVSASSSGSSASSTFYYGVTSVDSSGDESAQTLGASPASSGTSEGGGGGDGAAGGCFIAATAESFSFSFKDLTAGFLIIIGMLFGRRRLNHFFPSRKQFAALHRPHFL